MTTEEAIYKLVSYLAVRDNKTHEQMVIILLKEALIARRMMITLDIPEKEKM